MSNSTNFDGDGNIVGQTVSTNTITVFVGRKVGDNNYGNKEAALHLQVDVTEDDDLNSIEQKIKSTFEFGQTLVNRQLGLDDSHAGARVMSDGEMAARASHPTAKPAVAEVAARRLGPKAVPSARKPAPNTKRQVPSNPEKDAMWQTYLDDPSQWYDNRPEVTGEPKRNPRGPDFKHKKDGTALWVDSAPEWAKMALNGEASVV